MKHYNTHGGYSTIIILITLGFLLVITVGVFNLVLREMYENRVVGHSIKAFAGAESAQELALMRIKQQGYGFYKNFDFLGDGESWILADDPVLRSYSQNKDALISYDIGSKVDSYSGTLNQGGYDIIPLFYVDESGAIEKISSISQFIVDSGNPADLVWNIISEDEGISSTGESTSGIKRSTNSTVNLQYAGNVDRNIFIANHDLNYLVLYNTSTNQSIEYTLSTNGAMSKPTTEIISSAKVGNVRQNLSTKLNNTEFLGMLRYSIFTK